MEHGHLDLSSESDRVRRPQLSLPSFGQRPDLADLLQQPRNPALCARHAVYPRRVQVEQQARWYSSGVHLGARQVLGPLAVAPLSETWGRLPVYHTANVLFVVFSVVAARSTSMGMLIAMRFLLGRSVASTVVNPCIVGDMFREEQRGKELSVMGIIPFIAPVVGRSIGGAISEALAWRWTFWLIAVIAGPLQMLLFVTFRETYRVRILEVKAAKLRKKTGNLRLRSKYEKDGENKWLPVKTMLRPLKLLIHLPVVLLVGMVGGVGMSLVYVIITSLPDVYEQVYGFSKSVVGLMYWGLGMSEAPST